MVHQAFLAEWPWERLGNYKYWVYAPFVFKLYQTTFRGATPEGDHWYCFMFGLVMARYAVQQFWNVISRLDAVIQKYEIHAYAVGFEQVDREFHSDNHMMLQFLLFSLAHSWFPGFSNFTSVWNSKGLLWVLLLHAGPTEFLYYWMHRIFHTDSLYKNYHSFHHLSVVPEPPTGFVTTMLEQALQSLLVCIPLLGAAAMGTASMGLVFVYVITFDFLKCVGHSNFEFVPTWLRDLPGAKYLIYTPSYHSLHHTEQSSNFCLFMPLYDYLGGTVDPKTDSFYAELRKGKAEEVPEFVFLAHCIDLMSSFQVSFILRTLAAHPYTGHWFLWFTYVLSPFFLVFWYFGNTFVAHKYYLNKLKCMAWVVPRHGFQYFLPFGLDGINKFIENAILSADAKGVKVLSLAALNKNETLNGGGLLFVKKHPNLRVRVVHGNTLTAAVIIKTLPSDVKEVFMNGATSKLGRAIALYLCCRGIRVLMLTSSVERFECIQSEAPLEFRKNLIQVTKYQAGKHCKTWIVGKWTWAKDQQWAPPGTHFHQFVVPPVTPHRSDCTYGLLAGMLLPRTAIKGMRTCEISMERYAVHACHAGGLIHALEGWTHHEVGSIDVQRIDVVWEAAMRHGFSPIA